MIWSLEHTLGGKINRHKKSENLHIFLLWSPLKVFLEELIFLISANSKKNLFEFYLH